MTTSSLRILLADDDPDEALLFKESLKVLNLNVELTFVQRGKDIFEALANNTDVDLIIIDVQMPDMDGLECLGRIKSEAHLKSAPVVMLAVSNDPVKIEEAHRLGAHYYMIKPYSQSNYVAALYRLFQVDWKSEPMFPSRENFVINFAFA